MRLARRSAAVLALLAVVIGAAVWFWASWLPRVRVSNQSGQIIRGLTITLDSTTYHLGDIPPGGSRTIRVMVGRDSAIHVQGNTAEGAAIDATDGYMTDWIIRGQRATVTIGAGGKVTIQ